MLYTKFPARLGIFAILMKLHSGLMRERDTNNGIYMHMLKQPDNVIARDKVTFLAHDQNFYARRMKESLYIDIYSPRLGL